MHREVKSQELTQILGKIREGDEDAAERLLPLIYNELRRLARGKMGKEKPGQTLQATALVHEAYLRLVGDSSAHFENRAHFFAAAAEAMRRILIERARRRNRWKRGGGWQRKPFEEIELANSPSPEPVDLIALDEALKELESYDSRMGQIVKLRYFAGLSVEETAKVLDINVRTVKRDWADAKIWLRAQMNPDAADPV